MEKALRVRTADVEYDDNKGFADLHLPKQMVDALAGAGFNTPSPVQQAAIPLGCIGSDLIVQAKSGTGKTVVFSVICLSRVQVDNSAVQALILAPTREIAIQSSQVMSKIASGLPTPAPTSAVFVGGLSIVDDEKKLRRLCHVALGTPGRVLSLVQSGALVLESLRMFVLDEADALLSESFYMDVTFVYDQLPRRKQVMAFSATYTEELLADLEPLVKKPQRVMLCEETVSLLGVKQFYVLVDSTKASPLLPDASAPGPSGALAAPDEVDSVTVFRLKVAKLLKLVVGVSFHQAVVFCNHKPQAEWLAARLTSEGYPAAYLSSARTQAERMEAMEAVRGFQLRVLVSTDVVARGVDLDRVNLVINLDLPRDSATYVHRVGRTGRFGTRGVSISLVTDSELEHLKTYLNEARGGEAIPLPDTLPDDLYSYQLSTDWEREALEKLMAAPKVSEPIPEYSKASGHAGKAAAEATDGATDPSVYGVVGSYRSPYGTAPFPYAMEQAADPYSAYPPSGGYPYPYDFSHYPAYDPSHYPSAIPPHQYDQPYPPSYYDACSQYYASYYAAYPPYTSSQYPPPHSAPSTYQGSTQEHSYHAAAPIPKPGSGSSRTAATLEQQPRPSGAPSTKTVKPRHVPPPPPPPTPAHAHATQHPTPAPQPSMGPQSASHVAARWGVQAPGATDSQGGVASVERGEGDKAGAGDEQPQGDVEDELVGLDVMEGQPLGKRHMPPTLMAGQAGTHEVLQAPDGAPTLPEADGSVTVEDWNGDGNDGDGDGDEEEEYFRVPEDCELDGHASSLLDGLTINEIHIDVDEQQQQKQQKQQKQLKQVPKQEPKQEPKQQQEQEQKQHEQQQPPENVGGSTEYSKASARYYSDLANYYAAHGDAISSEWADYYSRLAAYYASGGKEEESAAAWDEYHAQHQSPQDPHHYQHQHQAPGQQPRQYHQYSYAPQAARSRLHGAYYSSHSSPYATTHTYGCSAYPYTAPGYPPSPSTCPYCQQSGYLHSCCSHSSALACHPCPYLRTASSACPLCKQNQAMSDFSKRYTAWKQQYVLWCQEYADWAQEMQESGSDDDDEEEEQEEEGEGEEAGL